jgi:murein DD-endopeptidase MepM/ murein hydrolase activator NlpD
MKQADSSRVFVWLAILIFLIAGLIFMFQRINSLKTNQLPAPANQSVINDNTNDISANPVEDPSLLTPPIGSALSRVAKKPFGIYITPQNSPVQPEKFLGYHTGVDFEILPEEENQDVPIYAICSGPLSLKKRASGYGGVVVEQCQIDKQEVTIIYGHLKLDSLAVKIGDNLTAGEKIGILGKGYSTETDGERKHLHLSIHFGTAVNLLGYVQNSADLKNWLDITKYLK